VTPNVTPVEFDRGLTSSPLLDDGFRGVVIVRLNTAAITSRSLAPVTRKSILSTAASSMNI
jgi:hypothetical protein